MNHEDVCARCEAYPGSEATSPFGPGSVVYKVGGKIFALVSLEQPRINLKCDPERSAGLRERHPAVEPGYHMNKRHWNSVYWEREALDPALLDAWIAHSYELVVASLSRARRAELDRG